MLALLINNFINRFKLMFLQAAKFATVGLMNTILDYSVYISLTRLTSYFTLHYLQANMISFAFGFTSSYFLNRYWTFKDRPTQNGLKQFVKFLSVVLIGSFLIMQSVLYISVEWLQIYDLIGKAFGIILGFIWNFFVSRKYVFNDH